MDLHEKAFLATHSKLKQGDGDPTLFQEIVVKNQNREGFRKYGVNCREPYHHWEQLAGTDHFKRLRS